MKQRKNKVKTEHGMIDGLRELLDKLAVVDGIDGIIPGRIKKISGGGSRFSVQYKTDSGLKCIYRSDNAAQEVFIITSVPGEVEEKLRC